MSYSYIHLSTELSPMNINKELFKRHGFPKWAHYFSPIAFNGGGIFYAYDFRDLTNIKLVAVGAGNLEYESSVIVGKTLDEVLSKNINIEDEFDQARQRQGLS